MIMIYKKFVGAYPCLSNWLGLISAWPNKYKKIFSLI